MSSEWLRRRAGVLTERNFRRFYTGYVTSLLGTSLSTVAVAWAVMESGVSASGLGYVLAAGVVPQVILLAVAGAVADRLGRRCSRAGPRYGCSSCSPGCVVPGRRSSRRP